MVNKKDDLLGMNIVSIPRGLDFEGLLKNEDSFFKIAKYEGRSYKS